MKKNKENIEIKKICQMTKEYVNFLSKRLLFPRFTLIERKPKQISIQIPNLNSKSFILCFILNDENLIKISFFSPFFVEKRSVGMNNRE